MGASASSTGRSLSTRAKSSNVPERETPARLGHLHDLEACLRIAGHDTMAVRPGETKTAQLG